MSAVVISLALCFLLFVYTPLSLYLPNVDEFSYDVYDLMHMLLPVFLLSLAALLVLWALVFLIGRKKKAVTDVFAGVLFALFLGFYLQSTFLSSSLPVITGDEINWNRYGVQRILSILLWAAVIAGTVFLLRRKGGKKIAAVTSGLVTLVLILSLALTAFTSDSLREKPDYVTTFNGINTLSEDKNLVIFLADAVSAGKYRELLETHPEYPDALEDFTFYPNTLGAYPYTSRSVPFMITGTWYEKDGSFYSYCNAAYSDFPLLHALKNAGSRINLYEEDLLLTEENMLLFDNTAETDGSDFMYPAGFYKVQAKLIGFRVLPFDLKRYCVQTPAKIANSTQRYNLSTVRYTGNNLNFYNTVCTAPFTSCEEPVFSFIHITGAHTPYTLGADVEPSGSADYTSSVEASFAIFFRYLEALKAAGLYDNSAILLVADHGTNEFLDPATADPTGRQNPILFVKGIGEKHAYEVSDAPISFADLQDAYFALFDGKTGQDVFPVSEGSDRERRYLSYNLYDFTLHEYLQKGDASDPDTLVPSGVIFSE